MKILYTPLLKSCTTQRSLHQIHAHLLTTGLHANPILTTQLIQSYSDFSNIDASRSLFHSFQTPDSFMWGVMIKSHVSNLQHKQAISLYNHGLTHFPLSSFVLTPVLQACARTFDVRMGSLLHGRILKSGFESDSVLQTALLQMYGESGRLEDACRVLDEMSERDVVSWSLMISCCVRCGQAGRGLRLFAAMSLENVECDSVVMAVVGEACGSLGLRREAMSVHGYVLRRRWTEIDEVVGNWLVTMYSGCCDMESAEKLFRNAERSVVSWTVMISSYNKSSCYREALLSFTEMVKSNIDPSFVTVLSVLSSCGQLGLLREGKSLHGFSLRRGIDPHLNSLGSALISLYSSLRHLKNCFHVFNAIEEKTVESWNSLIASSVQNGSPEKALELFAQMLIEGFLPDSFTLSSVLPACGHVCKISLGSLIHGVAVKSGSVASSFVSNSLIDMYCKCGFMDTALEVFDAIKDKNVITWNAMIGGLSESNDSEKGIALFEQMLYLRVEMDSVTYLNAIKACTNLGCLNRGRWIHQKLITFGLKNDIHISAALTNMYAKCGDIEMARAVFDRAPEKNVVMWSSIISGHGRHGLVNDAFSLFNLMVESGVRPNKVTFMAVLSACCHAGLVEEGLHYFGMMKEKFGLEPQLDHCNSVVDLLCRAGQIDRAGEFIRWMQIELNVTTWRTLLNGCYIHHMEDIVNVIPSKIL